MSQAFAGKRQWWRPCAGFAPEEIAGRLASDRECRADGREITVGWKKSPILLGADLIIHEI